MERVLERCCGLDVHKKTVAARSRYLAPSINGSANRSKLCRPWADQDDGELSDSSQEDQKSA